MPDYETHLLAGTVLAPFAVMAHLEVFGPYLGFQTAVIAAMWAGLGIIIGGVVPDIDLHNSHPRALLNAFLCLGVAAAITLHEAGGVATIRRASTEYQVMSLITALSILVVAAIVVPQIVDAVMPAHRGIVHNPLFWGVVAGVPGLLLFEGVVSTGAPRLVDAVILAPTLCCVFIGSVIHIVLDFASSSPVRRTRRWS